MSYGHVVVGMVPPPDAHPRARVQAQMFPGTPQSLEPNDRFVVLPPAGRPDTGFPVDPPAVDVAILAHEAVDAAEVQGCLRRCVLFSFGRAETMVWRRP